MIEDVENGKVGVCIMKDMTRWGRDYLQVGNAMESIRTERGDLNREIEVTNKRLGQLKSRISKLQKWLKEEAEKIRKSVCSILRQEQRERQPHRKQNMER